jgi:hypothetical protein
MMSGPDVEQTAEPGARTAIEEMDRAVRALALELPAAVHVDVARLWQATRAEVAAAEERGAAKERERLAELFIRDRRTLETFAGDKGDLLDLLSALLKLGTERAS